MTLKSAIDAAAQQTERNPSDAQKESGNYAKGKVRLHGLEIAIENPKGGERSGVDKGGKKWSVKMPTHYGYVLGTKGADKDHVDVYVGPKPDSSKVWVVDQVDAKSGAFDEHKCLLGYASKANALADYRLAFSDGKGADRIGSVTELSVDEFKSWLRKGNTKQPMARRSYATGGHVANNDKLLDQARWLLQRYHGGRVSRAGYSEGGSPLETEAPPKPESSSWLDTRLPGTNDKSLRDFLHLMREETVYNPSLAASMTGVPTMAQGYDQFTDPGADTVDKVEGAAKIGMGALPMGGRFLGPLTSTTGRSFGTYGALMAPGAYNEYRHSAGLIPRANAGEAQASGLIPSAEAAPLPSNPAEDEGRAWERAQAEAGPKKLDLPPLPEMPKKYEGELRKPAEVQRIQRDLIQKGLLPPKKPDGRPSDDGNDGGATRDAELAAKMADYDKAIERYERIKKLNNEGMTAETKASEAEGETKRKAANKKFQDDPANETSGWRSGARALAPYLGLGVGAILGGRWGAKTTRLQGEAEKEAAKVAESIYPKRGYAGKPFGEKVGMTNRFYTEGGSEPPFVATNTDPFWKINTGTKRTWPLPSKKPLEATDLYDPGWRVGPQLSNASYAGILAGVDQAGAGYLIERAEKEREEARAAYELNSNTATKARLDSAEDAVAGYYALLRAGQMGATTKLAGGAYGLYKLPPTPVNTSKASDARTDLAGEIVKRQAAAAKKRANQAAAKKKKNPPKGPGNGGPGGATPLLPLAALPSQLGRDTREEPAPVVEEIAALPDTPLDESIRKDGGKVDKHHSNFQPRRIGKFSGGPVYPKYKNGGSTSQRGVDGYDRGGGILNTIKRMFGGKVKHASGGSIGSDRFIPLVDNSMNRPRDSNRDEVYAFDPRQMTQRLQQIETMNADKEEDDRLPPDRMPPLLNPTKRDERHRGYSEGGTPLDYGNEKPHPTESVPSFNRRPEDVRDPQAPKQPMPGFPTLPFTGGYFKPEAWRLAGENIGPRMWDAATTYGLPLAALALRRRGSEMAKMKEAEAYLQHERGLHQHPEVQYYKFDRGIGGGNRNPYDVTSRGSFTDSSTDLAMHPGATAEPFRPAPLQGRPPANTNLPDGWSIAKAYGGGVGFNDAYAGYEEGGAPEGANNEGLIQTGLVHGATGGREDARPVSVRSGAFVIPSDVVAALGGSNTLAGAKALDQAFKKRRPLPGVNMATGQDVPIRISDGEYLVDPEQVYEIGNGDMDRGHSVLDSFVLKVREKHVHDLQRMPPPAKS